jgi:hypothetical protein
MRSSTSKNAAHITRLRTAISALLGVHCVPFEEGGAVVAAVSLRQGARFELGNLLCSAAERVGSPVRIDATASESGVKLEFSVFPPLAHRRCISREMAVFAALACSVAMWTALLFAVALDYAACGTLPTWDTPNIISLVAAIIVYGVKDKCSRLSISR